MNSINDYTNGLRAYHQFRRRHQIRVGAAVVLGIASGVIAYFGVIHGIGGLSVQHKIVASVLTGYVPFSIGTIGVLGNYLYRVNEKRDPVSGEELLWILQANGTEGIETACEQMSEKEKIALRSYHDFHCREAPIEALLVHLPEESPPLKTYTFKEYVRNYNRELQNRILHILSCALWGSLGIALITGGICYGKLTLLEAGVGAYVGLTATVIAHQLSYLTTEKRWREASRTEALLQALKKKKPIKEIEGLVRFYPLSNENLYGLLDYIGRRCDREEGARIERVIGEIREKKGLPS